MKERISATIEPETSKALEMIMKSGRYRNKSHAVEEAIKFFKERKGYEQ